MNFDLTSKIVPTHVPVLRRGSRYQWIAEYEADICVSGAFTDSREEAVAAFLIQSSGCEEGGISLFGCDERRVVASVKWKMDSTDIALRVPHRQHAFHDWPLALIALEGQKRRVAATVRGKPFPRPLNRLLFATRISLNPKLQVTDVTIDGHCVLRAISPFQHQL